LKAAPAKALLGKAVARSLAAAVSCGKERFKGKKISETYL
jgi:hypothetical protein